MRAPITLIIFFLFIIPLSLIGQVTILLKPVKFNTEADSIVIMRRVDFQCLLEKGNKLNFKQILTKPFLSQFSDAEKVLKGVNKASTVWFRYRVQNNLGYPLQISITEYQSRADVYISADTTNWQHYVTGFEIPWSKRDGLKKLYQITYTIPAHSTINVYERDENISPKALFEDGFQLLKASFSIKKYYVDIEQQNGYNLLMATVYGFFLFAAIISLFFFYVVREKEFLINGIVILLESIAASPYTTFLFREMPQSQSLFVRTVLFIISSGAFMYNITFFLRTAKYHPMWNKTLLVSITAFLVCNAVSRFGFYFQLLGYEIHYVKLLTLATNILGAIAFLQLVIIITIDLVNRRRESQLFMLAILPYISLTLYNAIAEILNSPVYFKYNIFVLVWALIVLSWMLFDRFKLLQAENARQLLEREEERNRLILQQKAELEVQVAERTAQLSLSLSNLKAAQTQLIQSEKMASLGELTAGIAHEIQNPLNFVNNFSEVSVELLEELKEEAEAGNKEDVLAIADDLTLNLQKINHHGKRADFIVKGMLQHSRASGGERQLTDINVLADEFLKLSYHGLRAKDKNFNAELLTNFNEGLPKVNVVQQDIGRVLLNLFNNAFYAVNEKKKTAGADYKPEVTVSTSAQGNYLIITVKDNGVGIPDSIKDKVMQPFFTTKPTGEGTGLGLSLSYDIVVKGHGGEINIESKDGRGSEFIIKMPLS